MGEEAGLSKLLFEAFSRAPLQKIREDVLSLRKEINLLLEFLFVLLESWKGIYVFVMLFPSLGG